MLRIQRNFGSRLKNKLKPDSIAFVQYPNGKSDPGAQRSRFCSCCENRRSESACVRDSWQYIISVWQCIRTYDKGNHSTNQSSGEVSDYKLKIYSIIDTKASRKAKPPCHFRSLYASIVVNLDMP